MNRFVFYAAGQGLFYTGSIANIYNNSNDYNFVYDCGTDSDKKILENEIDNYVSYLYHKQPNRPIIDNITISHLHSDHMNGLKYLIDCCRIHNIHIREINLPYLGHANNVLHLILAYELLVKGENNSDSFGTFELIRSLYSGEYNNRTDGEPPRINLVGREINNDNYHLIEDIDSKDFNYKIYNFGNRLLRYHWNFIYLNRHMSHKKLNDLEQKIQNETIKYNQKNPGSNINNITDLVLGVNNANTIDTIKDIYEQVFKKGNQQNLTSTVLIHYPTNQLRTEIFNQTNCFCPRYCDRNSDITLLCGDAEFDATMNHLMEKHIPHNRNYILQVPHHGSYKNWDSLSFGIKSNCDVFVIPFGYNNRYRHPDGATVLEILKLCNFCSLYCATQYRGLVYEIV